MRNNAATGQRSLSRSHLCALAAGKCRPTPEVIELVCRAFDGVQPESFVEWRLWQIQSLFDPERVGLDAAISEMHAFEQVSAARRVATRPAGRESRRHSRAAA